MKYMMYKGNNNEMHLMSYVIFPNGSILYFIHQIMLRNINQLDS